MLLKSKIIDAARVSSVVASVSRARYQSNVGASVENRGEKRGGVMHTRFTLNVRDSYGVGARKSASGRHMPKASWQAHRDVMFALFEQDPDAVLITALATYVGRDDFNAKFEDTGDRNVGSRMEPALLRDTAV